MSGAKDHPKSTDVQSDQKAYAEGWERIFGKKERCPKPNCAGGVLQNEGRQGELCPVCEPTALTHVPARDAQSDGG